MTTFFDRKVVVKLIGTDGFGVEIDGLDISFKVEKTKARHPNKAKIEIFNLDKVTAAKAEAPGASVELYAGYPGTLALIFRGQMRKGKVKTKLNGTDRVTTIEAGAGLKLFSESRINKSYGTEVSYRQVLEDIGKSFGSKIRIPDGIDASEKTGGVLIGRSADVMESLADSLGFDWFFDDDDALVITAKGADTGETAILLSEKTGLIGEVVKTNKGIEATALLNAGIKPKRLVEIRTIDVKGFFRVQEVEHEGDNFGGQSFYTKLKAVQIGGNG
jgi:hypothetical protein